MSTTSELLKVPFSFRYEFMIRKAYKCKKEEAPGAYQEMYHFFSMAESRRNTDTESMFEYAHQLGTICTYIECAIYHVLKTYKDDLSEDQITELKRFTCLNSIRTAKELQEVVIAVDAVFNSIGLEVG